ncbi:hypothetical protein MMC21_002726 [Puttea exsequens]|nr:hypothetical protein [Puttea exsequens]
MSESTAPIKVPALATRRAACTHVTTERIFGDFACSFCNRVSDFGWVYSCTQDSEPKNILAAIDDKVPAWSLFEAISKGKSSDAGHFNARLMLKEDPQVEKKIFQMPSAKLNPWVDKAINDGHYTPEQAELLRVQKQKVFETARDTVKRFEEMVRPPLTPTKSPLRVARRDSLDSKLSLPFSGPKEISSPSEASTDKANSAPSDNAPSNGTAKKFRMFPYCQTRACHYCRPTWRDRTWECLDHVFENTKTISIKRLDARYPPISSVAIMRTIGLRKPLSESRPSTRGLETKIGGANMEQSLLAKKASRLSLPSIAVHPKPANSSSADISDETTDGKGFRQSLKQTLRSMMARRSVNTVRKISNSSAESSSTEVDAAAFDMGLWKITDDTLLREAASVPLPRDDVGMEGDEMGNGALEGILVTEEAAETGTPDIIVSV